MMNLLKAMSEIGFSGLMDVFLMALLVYTLLVWVKRTRAASVLTGIIIVAAVYLFARQFNLVLTAVVFEKFFAVFLIALVIIFQQELKYFFEQVAVWSLNRRFVSRARVRLSREEVEILVRTVRDLAKDKIGALIVLKAKDLIVRHLNGGIEVNGKMSEALLKSIFDPHSMGHDGAVLIEGNRIMQFSCHLPLSKDIRKIGRGGTRHAAGLGLAEVSDALCIVISEERGTVAIARNGQLMPVDDTEKLRVILSDFYREIDPQKQVKPWEGFLRRNSREKAIALILSALLWFVLVFGAKQTYRTFMVPVAYGTTGEWNVKEMVPKNVYVTFGGPRNAFYFLSPKRIKLYLNLPERGGQQTVRIYPTDFEFPKNLTMEVLAPQEIKVSLEHREAKLSAQSTAAAGSKRATGLLARLPKLFSLRETHSGEEDSQPDVETGTSVQSVDENRYEKPQEPEKAQRIHSLEDANPDEVVKYLEQKIEDQDTIKRLTPSEDSEDKTQPPANQTPSSHEN
ncbi:MAG: diadenylate cyclase [Candidatus Omnitrophica bacterium]|nr:diadenylate cyclase [Candidatus Omnitrophota bacterium]